MIDFEGEICDGWVATVTAQLAPLSIATVEEWHPQSDESPIRQYKRDELPAIWVSAAPDGITLEACGVLGMHYTIKWGVLTENGDPQAARQEHERIRQNVAALFGSYQFQCNTSFLTSGYPVSFEYEQSLGDAKQDGTGEKKSPFRTTSENEMRLIVLYDSPPVG
jgi:hypothetical protein